MFQHTVELEVRDYECDLQGIVNNANYLHYLEHARHQCLKALGISFAKYHEEKKDLVVTEAQIKYHKSLLPGDKFLVKTIFERRSKLRLAFVQNIYRTNSPGTEELVLSSEFIGVCIDQVLQKPVVLDLNF